MQTVKILGEAVGIQWRGVIDRSGSPTVNRLINGLIIGRFKRGRVDKPMLIDQKTIRGRLGFEPNNPFYQAVQDALDTGIPSVWVLRASSELE
jgi:nucleoside-diphosphate-sugar epimerase